jgi:cytochrome b subunit of formate dehydrogenase/5-methylcytosine-specific restriction endonuclease McrA
MTNLTPTCLYHFLRHALVRGGRFAPCWLAIGAALLCAQVAAQATKIANEQCLKCHGSSTIAQTRPAALAAMVRIPEGTTPILRDADRTRELYVEPEALMSSAHAGLACVDCHKGIERLPHDQRLAVINCSDCHPLVESSIQKGMHKAATDKDPRRRPVCLDCHGNPHDISNVKSPRHYDATLKMTLACMQCHNEGQGPANPAQSYRENVHGKALFTKGLAVTATCVDCHGAHQVLPPSDPSSPVFAARAPETCGRCHEGVREVYSLSIHGQRLAAGDKGTATCTSCHSSHGIATIGAPFLAGMVQECSHCHAELGKSYLTSYHGKATALGGHETAVCSSCHGAHDILPASDPRSHVAPANLQATCAQCHQNVNANFVKYIPHVKLTSRSANPEVFWSFVIMTALLISVLAVFLPHGLLWFQRAFLERLQHLRGYYIPPPEERWVLRFRPMHRFTHFLIVVSFMGLVLTGFPLKYSYSEWAKEIASFLGGSHVMGLMHRGFAIVTFAYAGLHLCFLIWFFARHCPRPIYKYLLGPDSMIFSLRDLKDFIAMMRWFFWIGPRPKFDRWTYYEKFDYFGEIWGVFLIGGTGLILWFPTIFTRWLPGWVLNCAMVIHSIEALLAASVIFMVHFFNTHLRPEKFPIDMVMLTGCMSESEMKEERPAEYERLVASGQLEARIVKPIALRWRIIGGVFGIGAFLLGIALIALAIRTELSQLFH